MPRRARIIERRWRLDPEADRAAFDVLAAPRQDLLNERLVTNGDPVENTGVSDGQNDADAGGDLQPLRFEQEYGPFQRYVRTVEPGDGVVVERTEYRYRLPTVGWLIAPVVRYHLGRRGPGHPRRGNAKPPWWAPPDQLNERQLAVLGLLLAGSLATAYMNSLFSQTSTFAADAFGVGDAALARGGAIVRLGIAISLPIAIAADRLGRRRVVIATAFAAPTICGLGALATSFPLLVASQTIGRPLAITLDMVLAVIAAEEMPKSSRAYAVAVMALMYGLGAGLVVMGLPLADLGPQWWRADYVVAFGWAALGLVFLKYLPESIRFVAPHVRAPQINRRRLLLVGGVVVAGNLFVAPASFFLNRYLSDVRGLSATTLALFSLSVGTPAGLGLVIGGKVADRRGRRILIAIAVPVSTALIVVSFSVAGAAMWFTSFIGGLIAGVAAPALLVYRAELFPTGNRGRAAGILNTAALVAGSVSIALVGTAVDRGWSFGTALAVCGLGQLVVVALILFGFPESAHRDLEDLNEIDQVLLGPS